MHAAAVPMVPPIQLRGWCERLGVAPVRMRLMRVRSVECA